MYILSSNQLNQKEFQRGLTDYNITYDYNIMFLFNNRLNSQEFNSRLTDSNFCFSNINSQ